jgi:hypothetical protein
MWHVFLGADAFVEFDPQERIKANPTAITMTIALLLTPG